MRLILPRGRFRLEFLLKILHAFRISLMKSLNPIQTNIANQELFFFSGTLNLKRKWKTDLRSPFKTVQQYRHWSDEIPFCYRSGALICQTGLHKRPVKRTVQPNAPSSLLPSVSGWRPRCNDTGMRWAQPKSGFKGHIEWHRKIRICL